MAVDTGHGAVALFGTNTTYNALNFVSMSLGSQTLNDVEITDLGDTTWRKFLPGDVRDTNEITLTVRFDPTAAIAEIALGTVETLQIDFPLQAGTTEANLIGSGYIKSYTYPELATDTVMDAEIVFKYDGNGTVPNFTAEV